MDDAPFDALARLVAARPSRRQLLRLLAGSLVGGGLAVRETSLVTASCGPGCCPDSTGTCWCCSAPFKNCCPGGHWNGCFYQCCSDADCPGGEVCQAGAGCVCPAGQTRCGGTCVNTGSDIFNCGACGHSCPAGQSCCNGTCVFCPTGGATCVGTTCPCPAGKATPCDNVCTDTGSDPNNCGACGSVCPALHGAQEGCCGGVCTNITTVQNCGGCGVLCATTPGTTPGCCDGRCTDTSSDFSNCGSCGNECPLYGDCVNGHCQCPPDLPTVCERNGNQFCVDLKKGFGGVFCGSCGHACNAGQRCVNGSCVNLPLCRGRCNDACRCPGGGPCQNGVCHSPIHH